MIAPLRADRVTLLFLTGFALFTWSPTPAAADGARECEAKCEHNRQCDTCFAHARPGGPRGAGTAEYERCAAACFHAVEECKRSCAAPAATAARATLELIPLGTLAIRSGETIVMPTTPAGKRIVIDFAEVTIEGDRLRGKKVGPAGDWLVIAADGTATLDIRFLIETPDGARILVTGKGRTDATRFNFGAPLYFAPLFETADSRYAWLNRVQGIARGRAGDGGIVTFDLFEAR